MKSLRQLSLMEPLALAAEYYVAACAAKNARDRNDKHNFEALESYASRIADMLRQKLPVK